MSNSKIFHILSPILLLKTFNIHQFTEVVRSNDFLYQAWNTTPSAAILAAHHYQHIKVNLHKLKRISSSRMNLNSYQRNYDQSLRSERENVTKTPLYAPLLPLPTHSNFDHPHEDSDYDDTDYYSFNDVDDPTLELYQMYWWSPLTNRVGDM